MAKPHLLFVTGKLAEPALRRQLEELAPRAGFDYSVSVLPITVAALATTGWIARHLQVPAGVERVILPGLCQGDLAAVTEAGGAPAAARDRACASSCSRDSRGAWLISARMAMSWAP